MRDFKPREALGALADGAHTPLLTLLLAAEFLAEHLFQPLELLTHLHPHYGFDELNVDLLPRVELERQFVNSHVFGYDELFFHLIVRRHDPPLEVDFEQLLLGFKIGNFVFLFRQVEFYLPEYVFILLAEHKC